MYFKGLLLINGRVGAEHYGSEAWIQRALATYHTIFPETQAMEACAQKLLKND